MSEEQQQEQQVQSQKEEQQQQEEQVEEEEEFFVFVPGFKGSRLVDAKTREALWLSIWGALPFTPVPPLALPGERTLQLEGFHCNKGPVVPDGPLESLFGGVYQVYGPFLRFARKRWGAAFSSFAYDWRQDITATAKLLEDYLIDLLGIEAGGHQQKRRSVTLIAHSMGGLVVWAMFSHLVAVLEERQSADDEEESKQEGKEGEEAPEREHRAKLVALAKATAAHVRVVFVGTPFQALEAILEDMTPGTAMHYSYLPSDVVFTFPSAFELALPPRDQCDPQLYDADFWERRRVAAFGAPALQRELATEFRAIARDMLDAAAQFRAHALRPDFAGTALAGVRVATLTGSSHLTKTGLPAAFFDLATPIDWQSFKREPGDGRVPHSSATALPAGLEVVAHVSSKGDHGGILRDTAAVLEAVEALRKAQ